MDCIKKFTQLTSLWWRSVVVYWSSLDFNNESFKRNVTEVENKDWLDVLLYKVKNFLPPFDMLTWLMGGFSSC